MEGIETLRDLEPTIRALKTRAASWVAERPEDEKATVLLQAVLTIEGQYRRTLEAEKKVKEAYENLRKAAEALIKEVEALEVEEGHEGGD